MQIRDTAVDQKVSLSIANWHAFNQGLPWLGSAEYPFFTDAWIVGELEVGPYFFLNTVAVPTKGAVKPGIVLRYAFHQAWEHPTYDATDAILYHGGSPAEELAALASLCLGVRFRSGRSTRRFEPGGNAKGQPEETGDQTVPYFKVADPPIVPIINSGKSINEGLSLIPSLLTMPASQVNALVRAARLYQDALWLCESSPEMSWLLLVSALESLANEWNQTQGQPTERLALSRPGLFSYLESHSDKTLLLRIAEEFSDALGSTQKFVKFCLAYMPDAPTKRPVSYAQFSWSRTSMRKALSKVYEYRSRALHDGRPFPAPMCSPPFAPLDCEAPTETMAGLATHQRGATWLKEDVPFLLHIFEYISRATILNWWRSSARIETANA